MIMVGTSEMALSKPAVYETKRILLTSPMLHIGSAVSRLSPFEYVQTGSRVYLPNQEALARSLKQKGFLDQYIYDIENRNSIIPLLEDAFGDEWQKIKNDNGEPIFPRHLSSLKWTEERITDLRPMIRNGFGELYVPGSSIKGAIRTAIAYHLLKHSSEYNVPKEQRVSEIENRLRRSMGELKRKAKFADDEQFMNHLFSDFELSYQKREISARTGPNTDFMRAVQVADSAPLIEEKTTNKKGQPIVSNLAIVPEVLVSSHFPDGKAKYRASIYAEMVRSVRTEFTISVDREMLSWFRHSQGMKIPFCSVADILKICQEFAQDQWDGEHDYWQEIKNNSNAQGKNLDFGNIRSMYEPEQCPHSLKIGWGSGMTGTTVTLLFQDDLRAKIRDACGIAAPGFEAPKSRRTVIGKSGEIRFVPGWVKFKVLS
jgi:CRISPR-associated protein Csm5